MKRVTALTSGILLAATAAFAQPPTQGAPQRIGITTGLQRAYDNIKLNLSQAADKLPEADYSFKPAPPIDNEEYGIITVYLRLKNLVPPSTERQGQRRRGGQ